MKLLRGAQRDNLFNSFLSVSQGFNFVACSCPMFAPVHSTTNFLLKKNWQSEVGAKIKEIIELVKTTVVILSTSSLR